MGEEQAKTPASASHFVGREVCAGCHKGIAATQARTAMALTWQDHAPKALAPNTSETHLEGPDPAIGYLIRRKAGTLTFEVTMPGEKPVQFPIEVTMGGERHGLSFLARVHDLDGLALARAPLVETRYLHYAPENRLALSPGFLPDKPASYETALGRVLTPRFETKCLTCHGEPRTHGSHLETGVGCESCHGPGSAHLAALARKIPPGRSMDKGILNPRKLPVSEQMQPCSQCHAGFSNVQDPMPDDLLISDQVTALSNSECWRQSAGQITCISCHNPHQDAPSPVLIARSAKTCLGCHSNAVPNHAALCSVNRVNGCIGCHMPSSKSSAPFIVSDHWIRVHPERNGTATLSQGRSAVTPKRLFLRMMVLNNASQAASVRDQIASGSASFFDLARANSLDRASAMNGGYLGDVAAGEMDPAWSAAALALQPGEVSQVIANGGKYFLVGRMPRNFREEAEARFNHAMELRKSGDRQGAAVELLEALKIYPRLLRALTYLGVSYAESGNPATGAGILNVATRLYPQDAGAHFNLGIAYGAMGKEDEIAEYKTALAIDPDYVPAYLNWGAALYAKGQYDEAIKIYRQGIEVNPLVASLHYSLSLAFERVNQAREAKSEMELALRIDPKVTGQH